MFISKIEVKNFRLLKNIWLSLEPDSTVIVGRNNSGKTSLTELLKRLLSESSPRFSLEDFNVDTQIDFWNALGVLRENGEDEQVRNLIPSIEVILHLTYSDTDDLGMLQHFIVDLDMTSTTAIAHLRYSLKDGELKSFFDGLSYDVNLEDKSIFFKEIKERLPRYFETILTAVAPGDPTNFKTVELKTLRSMIQTGFITAQRGLDDTTHKEKDVLGKVLERLFTSASSDSSTDNDKEKAKKIDDFVKELQTKIDAEFTGHLASLLPGLNLFGYPGLSDPKIKTETVLNAQSLLSDFTKLKYSSKNGLGLPETYNGLGSRNLIFILFQLYEFFKVYKSLIPSPSFHIVFIEEPEAHLHPQMQEVFIRKVNEISKAFASQLNDGKDWPVQFIVTTHSTHMSNESKLESIRYFLNSNIDSPQTVVKDLRYGLETTNLIDDKVFLQKFLTLTSCDLFFCDKAILVEGDTERILMPSLIERIDTDLDVDKRLSSQYLTVFQIGGAYSFRFFNLIDFLELKCLIITDLDSVRRHEPMGDERQVTYRADLVSASDQTSNATIKNWFSENTISPANLLTKSDVHKTLGKKRIAYQTPENAGEACGRSFEEAFLLANPAKFGIAGTILEKEKLASDLAKKNKKSNFALSLAIDDTEWTVPRYISEGLLWLSEGNVIIDPIAVAMIQGEEPHE